MFPEVFEMVSLLGPETEEYCVFVNTFLSIILGDLYSFISCLCTETVGRSDFPKIFLDQFIVCFVETVFN